MRSVKKNHERLAETLSTLFYPMAEVALYDKNDQVVCLFNRLTQTSLPKGPAYEKIDVCINKNQCAKAVTIPLDDDYYLQLIVETTLLSSLKTFLNQYLCNKVETAADNSEPDWQQCLAKIIECHCQKNNIGLSALTAQDKRVIVLSAHEKDLFRYQEASKYLAQALNVSRATIYNYLNQASQLKTLQIHQVDAFTNEPYSGNPAGVVLDADHLNEVMMKKITREMNLSETVFVLKSKMADIKLRYFTPIGAEVKFCGHSTVAALYMLAHKKMLGIEKPGQYEITLEANVGIISTTIAWLADDSVTIHFKTPTIDLVPSPLTHAMVAQALGISLDAMDCTLPVMFEKNNQDLYVTIRSLKQLGELQVDLRVAKQFAEKHQIVAYALLCNKGISKKSHIHMRCFAPAVGIGEDPFTGSVLGGLSAYVIDNHLIDPALKTIRIEQGHFIDRPGYVDLNINPLCAKESPLVIAKAHHFFSTEINL